MTTTRRRARRLLHWYPRNWRRRYGDEFAALLASEIAERPHHWRRTADVARGGVVARLTNAGLSSHDLEPRQQIRASLTSLGCSVAVFLVAGIAIWSQLTVGWQWSEPRSPGTSVAMVLMSGALVLFAVVATLAAAPIVWLLGRQLTAPRGRHRRGRLLLPAAVFWAGAGSLAMGARHFANGWPGTGGHPWAHQGLVPGGAAAFAWASTLSVSSYWAHPGMLRSFPAPELAWMALSPVAALAVSAAAVTTVRRLEWPPHLLRLERLLGTVAAVGMVIFLAGSSCWIVDGGPGPRNLFHVGAIDLAGLAVMAGSAAVAQRALHRARQARLSPTTTV